MASTVVWLEFKLGFCTRQCPFSAGHNNISFSYLTPFCDLRDFLLIIGFHSLLGFFKVLILFLTMLSPCCYMRDFYSSLTRHWGSSSPVWVHGLVAPYVESPWTKGWTLSLCARQADS